MRYLVAVDTVHTAAAACDYLDDRADREDAVLFVAVVDDPDARRDREEALNVGAVRLAGPDVETERREDDPVEEVLAAAEGTNADEILIGARAGTPDADGSVGSTARGILEGSRRPVVVVPPAEC